MRGVGALTDAVNEYRAIPAFSVYNLEMAQAIARAGEQTGWPVILSAGSSAFSLTGRQELARVALEVGALSSSMVGVHLDHSRSLEEIFACIDMGYTSVMFDGSNLSFLENIRWTSQVVERAHQAGVWVEAELVGVVGHEDVSTNAVSEAFTDPSLASEFVATTGIDALAVAIGNVHGLSATPAVLDLDLLQAIRGRISVPLVLHGASGLSRETLLACLDRGVAKVNVNAELRRAYLGAIDHALDATLESHDVITTLRAGRDAVTEAAVRMIRLLSRTE